MPDQTINFREWRLIVLVYIGFMERKSDLLGGSFVIFGRAKILF